jgi:hypothetical protein
MRLTKIRELMSQTDSARLSQQDGGRDARVFYGLIVGGRRAFSHSP